MEILNFTSPDTFTYTYFVFATLGLLHITYAVKSIWKSIIEDKVHRKYWIQTNLVVLIAQIIPIMNIIAFSWRVYAFAGNVPRTCIFKKGYCVTGCKTSDWNGDTCELSRWTHLPWLLHWPGWIERGFAYGIRRITHSDNIQD